MREGSIPARAGETGLRWGVKGVAGVYPRTGGGNDPTGHRRFPILGLSPHGRGKHFPLPTPELYLRSIPARAGETGNRELTVSPKWVYPRTGGGN